MRASIPFFLFLASIFALCQGRMQSQLKRHAMFAKRSNNGTPQYDDCVDKPEERPTVQTKPKYHETVPSKQQPKYKEAPTKPHPASTSIGGKRGNPTPGSNGLLASNTHNPDFILGVAIHSEYLKDSTLTQCIRDNFNLLVPEYEAKSAAIHQTEDTWQFDATDAILKFTEDNNMNFKIHTFFFDQTMAPYWEQYRGNSTKLETAMKKHIDGMMARYGEKALIVDVVNEIMAYDGSGNMKGDIFHNTLKDDYLPFVFNAARAASSHPILSLNDNDIEGQHAKNLPHKWSAFYDLLKVQLSLKSPTPIQAIGMECHFEVGKIPTDFEYVLGQIVGLGLQVMITELDIKNEQNDVQQQAKDFATVAAVCMKYAPMCKGVIFWGMTDNLDWLGPGAHSTLFADGCKDKGVTGPLKKVLQTGSL